MSGIGSARRSAIKCFVCWSHNLHAVDDLNLVWNCVGLACLYDGSDELTEPSSEDVVAFEASRQRLYMEQVLLLHQSLMSLVEGQCVSVG